MAKWSNRLPEEPLKYVGEAVMYPKSRPLPSSKENDVRRGALPEVAELLKESQLNPQHVL